MTEYQRIDRRCQRFAKALRERLPEGEYVWSDVGPADKPTSDGWVYVPAGLIMFHNGKHALPGRSLWLNKIGWRLWQGEWRLDRSKHKVTTDPNYLDAEYQNMLLRLIKEAWEETE